MADVLLIKPNESSSMKEYLGIYKMLKEEHVIFDVIKKDNLLAPIQPLDKYKLIIFPNLSSLSENEWKVVKKCSR